MLHIRALVFMLHVRALVFMLHVRALVFMLHVRAHVFMLHVRALVFMEEDEQIHLNSIQFIYLLIKKENTKLTPSNSSTISRLLHSSAQSSAVRPRLSLTRTSTWCFNNTRTEGK